MLIDEMERQERIAEEQGIPVPEVHLLFKRPGQNLDPNHYNLPTANEIAVVFKPGADNEPPETNIVVKQNGKPRYLSHCDPLIDRLVFYFYFLLSNNI